MMNRNYPTSSFTDPLVQPAQTGAWAYERSTASIKPSSGYGATHPESEHLHRQAFTSPHQLPTYATTHLPAGLSGVFDASLHTAGSNATETSVMNFLSAIESRTQQAGPATTSLLPQFKTPSWQTGMNSSGSTELFVTGALPSSGTFSTYQHPNAFPARTLASTPSLQDTTLSTSSSNSQSDDPPLHVKSTQATVPSALAFDRLGGTVLTTSLPPQSSTYRSAQESAPHLLQPQFSLLPSVLGGSQQAPLPYSTSVFSGSIERALQRECSVIKHHQRPSNSQSVQGQLPGSTQHSLQVYLPSGSEVPFQDALRQQAVPCSPIGDTTQIDERYNSQSVIRSNSRPEDQIVGLTLPAAKKDEGINSLTHDGHDMTIADSLGTPDVKRSSPLEQSSHVRISTEELKQHSLKQKVPESQPQSQQSQVTASQQLAHSRTAQQAQYLRLPSGQILLDPSRDLQMILLQQSLLQPGLELSKIPDSAQTQQAPVQYLQMDDQVISTNCGQSQQHTSQNSEVLKMDVMDTSTSLQQHISSKDNFSQASQHDVKQHFTLSSICFPDSILLADERNILSNVDDILAATAAACGVTPQDLAKATSSEGDIPLLASTTDSKGHLLLDTRHISSNFPSQHSTIGNTQIMTLNGSHLTMDVHQVSKGAVLHPQALELPNLHMQPSLISSGEKALRLLQENSSTSQRLEGEHEERTEEQNMNHNDGTIFNSNRINSGDKNITCGNGFHLAREECNTIGLTDKTKLSNCKNKLQYSGLKTIKMEDTIMEIPTNCFPKKKAKSKGSTRLGGEDENGSAKSVKRGQGKRNNTRGTDANSPSTSDGCYEGYHQQERMQLKIREVEERQPEVKTGFIGSFLDFLKSGPKQQFSSPPIRLPNRSRKSSASSKRALCPLYSKSQLPMTPLMLPGTDGVSPSKRLDEEFKKNLETLPSFSSDEEEYVGKNQDLQKSITSALSVLDDPSEKKNKMDLPQKNLPGATVKQEQSPSMLSSVLKTHDPPPPANAELHTQMLLKDVPTDQLALQLTSVAIEGLTDEDLSDSGGEGMYRERDEFVVKNEDIECLKMTLKAGWEPPAIWKVQKALLQKFVPELRNGTRVFSATNSYLGYFGDAKTMYRRVYVKFIDTVNKREYVRVCNRKPRCKPMHSMRGSQARSLLSHKTTVAVTTNVSVSKHACSKPPSKAKAKQPKVKAEPPPKKRKTWKEGFTTPPGSTAEAVSEDDELTPPVPFASRFLNTRTMKETFKSYVELLISVALDADVMDSLEKEKDELLLPHMRKVEGMLMDNRRRLLPKLRVGQLFKNALDSFPEFSLVTDLKNDSETPSFKVRLSGKAYNRKTMRPSKAISTLPLEYTVDKERTQWFSLYHSLQHYKYHTFLICKDEIESVQTQWEDLGQEETVQLCLHNGHWVEKLFDKFGELLTQVQQNCL
ncbi:hypothetical protein AGOR_G00007250 [Albula goreensis]|uniref:DUF4211 domain-containing protein n=1 Tax=Albula goreensis TaxID=1534307 RepID=A0A8T3E8N6_9TELE|nr:hypothetical protein AGOR_G00007250 [Albula goreensis]